MRRIAIALPVMAALVQPLPALAYHVSAAASWPDRIVTYDDGSRGAYHHAVARVVAAFNASGTRLVLVPAAPGRGQITTRTRRHGTGGVACYGTAGVTTVRADAGARRVDVRIARGCRPAALFRLITAHELGHAVGLAHEERRCALMAPSDRIGRRRCGGHWLSRCRLLQVDDIRGLVRLYGGDVRPRSASRAACHDVAPSAPGSLTLTTGAGGGGTRRVPGRRGPPGLVRR